MHAALGSTTRAATRERPFAADQFAVPFQNRVWLEQEDDTVMMSASPTHYIREVRSEDGQYEFLSPGNARWPRLLALQDM